MEFLKSSELKLNPAGYLISTTNGKPVNHATFVTQQKNAEYIVKLAAAIKGKTFKAGKSDNLEAIKASVRDSMTNDTQTYLKEPTKPTSKVNDELVKFALDFAAYQDTKGDVSKINEFMNQFNSINDVEQVGDYFIEGVCKLSEIYSIKTILAAVQSMNESLD